MDNPQYLMGYVITWAVISILLTGLGLAIVLANDNAGVPTPRPSLQNVHCLGSRARQTMDQISQAYLTQVWGLIIASQEDVTHDEEA